MMLPAAASPLPRLMPPPPDRPLRWVQVDAHWVVVDKPAGLLSVPGKGEHLADCAASQVQARYPDARVVHRLDMGTSGLLVFARSLLAQQRLSRAFELRQVEKTYVAVVAGQVAADAGEATWPLRCDWPRRPRQMVDLLQGKPAVTRWQVLARDAVADTTRLSLTPLTCRSHQLRVHLLALGHPILGDELYAPARWVEAAPRLCLHAEQLALAHPVDGQWQVLRAECPF